MRRLLLVLLLLPAVTSAGEFGLESEHFRKGDFDALFQRWCGIIQRKPDTYEALTALWLCQYFKERINNYRRLEGVVEAALKKPLKNGYCISAYKRALRQFYLSRGFRKKADKLGAYDGLVTDWWFLEGFGADDGSGAFFIPYEPQNQYLSGDKNILKTTYRIRTQSGLTRIYRWRRPLFHIPPLNENVPISTEGVAGYAFPPIPSQSADAYGVVGGGGIRYALAQFLLEKEQTVLVEVRNWSNWFRLWFNAKEVLSADKVVRFEPDVKFVAVKARAGWNTILVKTPDTSLTVYLRDRRGKPLTPRFEKKALLHPTVGGEISTEEVFKPLSAWLREQAKKHNAGEVRYALVLYAVENQLANVAEELAHELAEEKSAFSRYFAALGFEAASHCPDAWAASRMKKNLDAALKAAPDFLPAATKLAHFLSENDKPEKAYKLLANSLKKAGKKVWALMELAQICAQQGWRREQIEAVKAAEPLNPNSPQILSFWANYYATYGNRRKFFQYQRRYLELYQRDGLEGFLAQQEARKGNLKPLLDYYLKMWRAYPEELGYLRSIVEIYIHEGAYKEALRLLRHAWDEFGDWVSVDYIFGTIMRVKRLMGDKAGAAETADILFLVGFDGHDFSTRRYAAFLRNRDDDFWKPYRLPEKQVETLMRQKITSKDYPRSPVLILLHDAVVEVLPDGAASEYHDFIVKVLTEEGRMFASRMGAPLPDTIRIESVTPDGKRYDPTPTQYGLVMEKVDVGGFVRLEGRIDGANWSVRSLQLRGRGACAHKRRVTFIFRAPKLTQKAKQILAKKGIVLPKPFEHFKMLMHNIMKERGISVRVSREGGDLIVVVEANKMEAAERDYFLPDDEEIFPLVETFVEERDWRRGYGSLFEGLRRGGRRVTWLVEQTARTVVGDAKSTYEKVRRLYDYCQSQIRDGDNTGAHATLLEMAGDRQAVFEACLKALGIKTAVADVFRVGLSAPPKWERATLPFLVSNSYLVVETEKGRLFVDASTRYCPLGRIAPDDQGMPALIAFPNGETVFIKMPSDPLPHRQRVTLRITADLSTKRVLCDFLLRVFPEGASLKDILAKMPKVRRRQIFEQPLSQILRGIKIDPAKFRFENLKDTQKPALVHMEGTYEGLMTKRKDGSYEVRLCVPSVQIGYRLGGKPERKFCAYRPTLDYDYQEVTLLLGKYKPVGKLPDVRVVTDFGAFVLKCVYDKEKNRIKVMRYFAVLPFRLEADRFREVLDFCRMVTEAEGLYLLVK